MHLIRRHTILRAPMTRRSLAYAAVLLLQGCAPAMPVAQPNQPGRFRPSPLDAFSRAVTQVAAEYVTPVDSAAMLARGLLAATAVPGVESPGVLRDAAARQAGTLGLPAQLALATNALKESVGVNATLDTLVDAALAGCLSGLDGLTDYRSREQYEALRKSDAPDIGVQWILQNGTAVVVRDMRPGRTGGVLPHDVLLSIDGRALASLQSREIMQLEEGPAGSTATLVVRRAGKPAGVTIPVTRMVKAPQLLKAELLGRVAYLRPWRLDETTARSLRQNLMGLQAQASGGLTGIVIDLRDNPGGLLDQVSRTAGLFLPPGAPVSRIEGRSADANQALATGGGGIALTEMMVVLVNEFTSAGAEMLAGALQDNRRALVVGQRTRGAGTVQTVAPVSGRGALRFTTGLVRLPSGRALQDGGIMPDAGDASALPPAYADIAAALRLL